LTEQIGFVYVRA